MDEVFKCSYCEQQLTTIKGYVNHCRFHRNECNRSFPCPRDACLRQLSTYSGLVSHLQRDHSKPAVHRRYRNVDIPLQCDIIFCRQVCNDIPALLKHLKEHLDVGATVLCPFNNCESSFTKKSSFTSHLSRCHKSDMTDHIPAELIAIENNFENQDDATVYAEFDANSLDELEVLQETDNVEDLFVQNLLLFYLQLESKYLLPSSTVQHIVEQFNDIHSLGQTVIFQKLLSKLTDELDIPEQTAKELINEMKSSDLLSECSTGPLRSDYIHKSTYKKKFNYVAPVPIKLGRNDNNREREFQYIPIKDSLQNLFKNKSVQEEYLYTKFPMYHGNRRPNEEGKVFYDITDGAAFKENAFFQDNPNALKLILYQDSFEVCNPLGSSKKKHKILAVYMTLANFRPHLRSSVNHMLLVLLCNENDFKYFGQEKLLRPLIDDLKDLELNGIDIAGEQHPVKGALSFIAGDNLGSHCIGGFVENFSSTPCWCRWCSVTNTEFHDNPCAVGLIRNENNYNRALQHIQDQDTRIVQGIKFDSIFNELEYFHVCSGLPPCLGHDLFEGVLNYDVALILAYFIKQKKWLTYTDLNRRIMQFKYLGSDRHNQPSKVNPSGENLGGQAVENWCLVRLLPVLIGDKISDPNDAVWLFFLQLHDMVELLCAPSIDEAQIANLSFLIEEYLESRHRLFPERRMRPKHHFLNHYPMLILQFGPLIRTWTMRFERTVLKMIEDIKSAIRGILSNISEDEVSSIAAHLCDEVGVEGPDDLVFVESNDLSMLKSIQIRKLIHGWKKKEVSSSDESTEDRPVSSSSHASCSGTFSPSGSMASSPSSSSAYSLEEISSPGQLSPSQHANWSRGYTIPWTKFSKPMMKSLENQERPKPSQRREMIRILVDDLQKITLKPSKSQLSHIAEKIVLRYPKSFKDVIGSQTIGTGYDSLLKNIQQRVYNQNRRDSDSAKRPVEPENAAQPPTKKKKTDQYGCINFSPQELPTGQTVEMLAEKKGQMKASFQIGEDIDAEGMQLTYYLQREDILSGKYSIPELQVEWPYLFEEEGLAIHFKELVGMNVKEGLEKAYESKGRKVRHFMQDCGKQQLQRTICNIERSKAELGNDSPEVPGLVILLMKYFGEEPGCLVTVMEPTTTKDDVDRQKDLPNTPFLIACGVS
ncbi:uncharacterized protein [Apostichopus japonicus]|uniref:uncharacterized protein isoform X2 n=2 Tax=Stichopus japonicus TaxID=307972 RepID=UPI003AB5BBEB